MSMVCCLTQVDEGHLSEISARPEDIRCHLFGEAPKAKRGFLARLLGRNRQPAEISEGTRPLCGVQTELDKAWHGIHFLLTGTDWEGDEPLCYLVKGGQQIGDVDVGYGPARALSKQQVRSFSSALWGIEIEELKKRFDPKKMMDLDIYPSIWDRDPQEDDTLGYLMWGFQELKGFVKDAADRDKCLIICIC